MSHTWTYEYSFPVPAPADRLFAALTSAEELERWFAEHARVDARPGGRFEFWGRHTVGTPGEGEAGGRITTFEPGAGFGFEWSMLGSPSTVSVSLHPEETDRGAATRVAIEHGFDRRPDGGRSEELVDDWWRFNLGNLTAHTTGHGEVMRIDFADDSPEIRLDTYIESPPGTVYRALTEPALLNQWIGNDASVDLRVGGTFDLGFPVPEGHDGPGMEILELVPERKIAISWPDWRGDVSVPPQCVTWELETEGTGTRVRLIHSGFVRAVDLSDYPFGWGHFMGRLKDVSEGR